MAGNYMDNFLDWLESTTPEERLVHPRQETRPWPYDGPEGRARLTGSLDTGGSFTGDDDDNDPEYRQSTTACCPRQTIPDSCSCPEGCSCQCQDCDCGEEGDDW